jgi:hypothetical protein
VANGSAAAPCSRTCRSRSGFRPVTRCGGSGSWRIEAPNLLNLTFCELYAAEGRPSVPPAQLLLASLLQAFYGIRPERLLLEQLNYNLLFRWFVGLRTDDPIWHPTRFTKNCDQLL